MLACIHIKHFLNHIVYKNDIHIDISFYYILFLILHHFHTFYKFLYLFFLNIHLSKFHPFQLILYFFPHLINVGIFHFLFFFFLFLLYIHYSSILYEKDLQNKLNNMINDRSGNHIRVGHLLNLSNSQ